MGTQEGPSGEIFLLQIPPTVLKERGGSIIPSIVTRHDFSHWASGSSEFLKADEEDIRKMTQATSGDKW